MEVSSLSIKQQIYQYLCVTWRWLAAPGYLNDIFSRICFNLHGGGELASAWEKYLRGVACKSVCLTNKEPTPAKLCAYISCSGSASPPLASLEVVLPEVLVSTTSFGLNESLLGLDAL